MYRISWMDFHLLADSPWVGPFFYFIFQIRNHVSLQGSDKTLMWLARQGLVCALPAFLKIFNSVHISPLSPSKIMVRCHTYSVENPAPQIFETLGWIGIRNYHFLNAHPASGHRSLQWQKLFCKCSIYWNIEQQEFTKLKFGLFANT